MAAPSYMEPLYVRIEAPGEIVGIPVRCGGINALPKKIEIPISGRSRRTSSLIRMKLVEEKAAMEGQDRPHWGSKLDFILTTVGLAVGLGNVWRFPKICMENGGGVFVIPYLVSVFVLGIPAYTLELGVGQVFQMGPMKLWRHLDPRFSGLAFASLGMVCLASMYYAVVCAWILYYLLHSFQSPLPWAKEYMDWPANTTNYAKVYFEEHVLQHVPLSESGWIGINFHMTAFLALLWILIYCCIHKGIESSAKVAYFTATFPYIVLAILIVRGVTLPGAWDGIKYYLTPDLSQLLNLNIWLSAMVQIFYSMGIGWGANVAFASYNPRGNNFVSDAWLICCINCGTSLLAGLVVFSVAGHLAHLQGGDQEFAKVNIKDLNLEGPGLAFIAFPTVVAALPGAWFFAILFFIMLACLGIGSQFALVESVVASIRELEIAKWMPQNQLAFNYCVCSFLGGILFCTRGAADLVNLFDTYVCIITPFIACILQIVLITKVYGLDDFQRDVREACGIELSLWLRVAWKYIDPTLCGIMVVFSLLSMILHPCHLSEKITGVSLAMCSTLMFFLVPLWTRWRTTVPRVPVPDAEI